MDDDDLHLEVVAGMVAARGYRVETAGDGEEALEKLGSGSFHVIISDLVMPRIDGFQLLRTLMEHGDTTPAIVLTGFTDITHAISVVHDLHAFWFLEKPVQPAVLDVLLERAVRQEVQAREIERLRRQVSYGGALDELVGQSQGMQHVFALIQNAAPSSAPVFIGGESGTTQLAARAIHRLSSRSAGPFIALNCAALPRDSIESELFGHERGSFTPEPSAGASAALNRRTAAHFFWMSRGNADWDAGQAAAGAAPGGKVRRLGGTTDAVVDVRIIAATNRSPEEAVREKRLREDLYYRINVFQISLPALRHRKVDLPELVSALIEDLNRKHGCQVTGAENACGPD